MNKPILGAQYVPKPSANIPEMVLMNRKGDTYYLPLHCLRFTDAQASVERERRLQALMLHTVDIDLDDIIEQRAAALVGP